MLTLKTQLETHLKERYAQLLEAKEKGTRIIGYFPGNYVPEELIVASGAVPLCLIEGGDAPPLDASSSVIPQVFCPFARTQIGERLLKRNPYYRMMDLFIAPITCQHLRKVAEIWEYNDDMDIFKLGIPHQTGHDFEIAYFTDRLKALTDKLEMCTGNRITRTKIAQAIDLYNRMRALLRGISLLRQADSPSIDGLDFVELNHASLYADPEFMVDFLESVYSRLRTGASGLKPDAPRLLLIGPNIAAQDYKVLEMVRKCGGNIVIEEIFEGIRYYWPTIDNNGEPLAVLAESYLKDRVPPAFMRYASKPRLDFALRLIEDFKVAGVIWYGLRGCETYDAESFYFSRSMADRGIPMLVLESDYGVAGTGQMEVRVDAFMEMLKGELV